MMWVSGPLVHISSELKRQWLGRRQKALHRAQAIGSLMPELQAAPQVAAFHVMAQAWALLPRSQTHLSFP